MGFTMGEGRDTRTFRNRVEALQNVAETMRFSGQRARLTRLYMPTARNDGYSAWSCHFRWRMTFEQYKALAPVAQRLSQMHHFFTEVDAAWKDVPGTTVSYMDNSVEVTQRDRHGNTRRKLLVAPSGDACF